MVLYDHKYIYISFPSNQTLLLVVLVDFLLDKEINLFPMDVAILVESIESNLSVKIFSKRELTYFTLIYEHNWMWTVLLCDLRKYGVW